MNDIETRNFKMSDIVSIQIDAAPNSLPIG